MANEFNAVPDAPSLPDLGLWKMASVHEAGSATPVHPGKKEPSKMPTSAFAASCQAIPI